MYGKNLLTFCGNDLLVADRQKKNGMSWSVEGSTKLTTLKTLKYNDEYENWFKHGSLKFELPMAS